MGEWPKDARRRYESYRHSPLSWDPLKGGKRPLVAWNDDHTYDLGRDPGGQRFQTVSKRMLSGDYYPPDAISSFGPWIDEDREIRVGDRNLQRARVLPFSAWPVLWSMTEIFVAERTETTCILGYVTTKKHFGRGIWHAELSRRGDALEMHVTGFSGPASWQFWLGLPVARWLQKRAWRRAIEEFRVLGVGVEC